MRTDVVFTLTGPDRVGLVEEVTGSMLGLGANVGGSRMARLGGAFAILMQVSLPVEALVDLDAAFAPLTAAGYAITTSADTAQASGEVPGHVGTSYRIEVSGADHEGIVHDIAAGLAAAGINIESMETRIVAAPISGAPLFEMTALVSVPTDVDGTGWIATLTEAAARANVDVEVSPGA
ncbi:MAG: ACT domain-containing protein [Coriobacteriia bacterium]|nr:ACT domain-containing protein [Coriobacteriia bacterium]